VRSSYTEQQQQQQQQQQKVTFTVDINFTSYEARIIGCLIEKEITTPDQYPLSLNALVNACNQKSNREPVFNLDEPIVQETLDELIKKHLATDRTGYGGRVLKYKHRFCNVDFGSLELTDQELGIICVMLLRGPRTPGELRTQTNRLCKFNDVHEVEAVLQQLTDRKDGPFVVKLPREPGKRESRYAHLLSGEVEVPAASETVQPTPGLSQSDHERINQLEQQVQELQQEMKELKELIL